ncbi:MAG: glycogen/starch synthase [Leadbetterella sp.]
MAKFKQNTESTEKVEKREVARPILFELAWEVCNQVGGIYTVIRSKVPAMVEEWKDNYCLIGPYFPQTAHIEFENQENDDSIFAEAAKDLRNKGLEVHYGRWLVTGKPRIILVDFNKLLSSVDQLKFGLWENFQISTINCEKLVDSVVAFGEGVVQYLEAFSKLISSSQNVICHFHEWMASLPILGLKHKNINFATVFTTHATMLGRYIAGNDQGFYEKLESYKWDKQAEHYGILAQAQIERFSAQNAHVLSTVSDVTARECEVFFGRTCDIILPNGLNITRYTVTHEFQNQHQKYKERINEFVMGHFFQSYSFNLDKTIYFFTSGRYEYVNKGYDLTLEALKILNKKLKSSGSEVTVVMFMITKNPVKSLDPQVLQSKAVMEEIRQTCEAIEKEIGDQLFYSSASEEDVNLPDLNSFVSEYWRLRLRRTIQTWKTHTLPKTVTHLLEKEDEITDYLEKHNLMNHPEDKVKFVYHPDFISPTNPLFGLEYGQFVRGCHLGVFPSYYEPWGYTPLECIIRGIPTVTSDLSGFGDFMKQLMHDHENVGVYVLNRKNSSFASAAEQLADIMFKFTEMSQRERIMQRNKVENISDVFDWTNLRAYYDTAHDLAIKKKSIKK